ncbi:hypothetical protein Y032_0265g666 [Ancylostoma ceylanicum]|uniref:Uncharacterized protein n=1 Tax=Ancylostoma ceylanicum TaxID=53326 RepID=A0A016S9H2_9BILA|nr:hypothetical protein Y032_0265g666 [Ancylostoma ceylanicum]
MGDNLAERVRPLALRVQGELNAAPSGIGGQAQQTRCERPGKWSVPSDDITTGQCWTMVKLDKTLKTLSDKGSPHGF